MAKKIMAWSKCEFKIAQTGANGAMGTNLASIGTIKDKSASLEASEGDTMEMKETGGAVVAKEVGEGAYKATCRVIEPDFDLLTKFGLGEAGSGEGDFNVSTHVVQGNFSLEITPKAVGAKGVKAPITTVTYKPGWSEEDGNYADIDFDFIKGDGEGAYWYSIFTKGAE